MKIHNIVGLRQSGNRSLILRLLAYLLIPVLLFILLAAGLAIRTSGKMINALHDRQMQASAGILLSFLHYELQEYESGDEDDDDDGHEEDDDDSITEEISEAADKIESQHNLLVSYRLKLGTSLLFTSSRVRHLPACASGFSNLDVVEESSETGVRREWRCFSQRQVLSAANLPIVVEFFEPVTQRRNAIRSLLLNTFLPVFLLPLVITLVTLWAVKFGMRSLRSVTQAVAQRSVDNLDRLPVKNQPEELMPIVESVNKLLDGIEKGMLREKQFTDDAAHELRTPITSIKMLEQLLRRENKDPALTEYLDDLSDSVALSGSLIEQLLSFARLQNSSELPKAELNMHEMITTQLGLLSKQLTGSTLAVDLEVQDQAVTIRANQPAMTLLINNLLDNAIKFSETKGTIYLTLTARGLRIEDDGPGIKPEDRERVFERFYRAQENRSTPGSGLGLALARWVADVHGFRLQAESPVKGTGASMVLYFSTCL